MFRSVFEKTLENATSHLHLEPDWPSIMIICDEINQKDVTPKNAFAAIKKKINSPNPHSAFFALLVLESVVKNCSTPIHDEVFTKENCEMFSQFLESTPHENVRNKMLELVQTWAHAFRSTDKYQSIKDTMNILKAKGHTFPELKEADAMFTAESAPKWADGRVCHRCRVEFTMTNRKHHCRNCGQVFCGSCSAHTSSLPKFGIEKDVRVCDGCYVQLIHPQKKTLARAGGETDLPAVYLNSSLAQQVQTPPRKTEQELKEEEELQLALALSQSEAEQKKQHQQQQSLSAVNYRMQQCSPSPEAPPAPKEYIQQEESNPDLEKYLNRSYWEQRKISESPMASPSAPTPTPQPQMQQQAPIIMMSKTEDEAKIDEFVAMMRSQVNIFVNRMKSNCSRGRSISNDTSVQTMFTNLTALHTPQLNYIKEMDDKRMWCEQLQDKLVQIKDSRAALDVLRQEHVEKLRLIAEEQERQRQLQMAQKLELMRKKKQEYLQYQRQLALQRIQDQEREMQMRQEQQMAQYRMSQTAFPFMNPGATNNSPSHQMIGNAYNPYAYNPNSPLPPQGQFGPNSNAPMTGAMYGGGQPGMPPHQSQHGPNGAIMPGQQQHHMMPGANMPQMCAEPGIQNSQAHGIPQQNMQQQQPGVPIHHSQQQQQQQQQHQPQSTAGMPPSFQQQPPAHAMLPYQNVIHSQQHQQAPISNVSAPPPAGGLLTSAVASQHQQQNPHQQPTSNQTAVASAQIQSVIAAPMPPQTEPEPVKAAAPSEPATAELISFD